MHIDPIIRQTFNYAMPISCDNNPQSAITLDFDFNEPYVLILQPVLSARPMLLEPKQILSAIGPNTLTAQEAGIFSNAELTNFWNRVLFRKHSDTTLKPLRKTILFDFVATCEQHSTGFL